MISSFVDLRTIDVSISLNLINLFFKLSSLAKRGPKQTNQKFVSKLKFI